MGLVPGGVTGSDAGVVPTEGLRPGVVEAAQRLGRYAFLAVERLLIGRRDEAERQGDGGLVVAEEELGEVLLSVLGPEIWEEGILGTNGMTDCTPADFNRSTASWASELVVAVSSGLARWSPPAGSPRSS